MEEVVDRVTLQALHDFRKKTWTVASANLIEVVLSLTAL